MSNTSELAPAVEHEYVVADIKRRLREVLGVEVTDNQIHLGLHRAGHTPNARVRPTAGIPDPIEHAGKELRWERSAVEEWLASHPRLLLEEAKRRLRKDAAKTLGGERRRIVVLRARDEGLSWAQVAEILSQVEGKRLTRQAVAERYSGSPRR